MSGTSQADYKIVSSSIPSEHAFKANRIELSHLEQSDHYYLAVIIHKHNKLVDGEKTFIA